MTRAPTRRCRSSSRARTRGPSRSAPSARRPSRRGATPTRRCSRRWRRRASSSRTTTRAAIIERLIDVAYVERDGRSLVCTDKGLNVIRLLGEHPITSPGLTGDWEHRLGRIELGEETRERFMSDIAEFARGTVTELDAKLKEVRIPRANLGPCPVCGQDIVENRKGFSCWSREDPGCGFVIWKSKAGKELIATGRTARPVTGFKGRSGKSFRARLALQQSEDGKWRVEFNEPWAREGAKPPESDDPAGGGGAETPSPETQAAEAA